MHWIRFSMKQIQSTGFFRKKKKSINQIQKWSPFLPDTGNVTAQLYLNFMRKWMEPFWNPASAWLSN